MRDHMLRMLAILLGALLWGGQAFASPQFGYVDLGRVKKESNFIRFLGSSHQANVRKYEEELTQFQKALAAAQESGEDSAALEKMAAEYKSILTPKLEELTRVGEDLQRVLISRVEAAVREVSIRKEVSLVLDSQVIKEDGMDTRFILWGKERSSDLSSPNCEDLTDSVISVLDGRK